MGLGTRSQQQTSSKARIRTGSLKIQRLRENALAYTFLAPSLILFAVFMFYPMIKSVYLSLHSTDPAGNVAAYVGLDNFTTLFSSGLFLQGIKVTLLFALLTVPVGILLALVLAALTHSKLRGMRIFQFAFSLPMVLSVGSSAVIWKFLFIRHWGCSTMCFPATYQSGSMADQPGLGAVLSSHDDHLDESRLQLHYLIKRTSRDSR